MLRFNFYWNIDMQRSIEIYKSRKLFFLYWEITIIPPGYIELGFYGKKIFFVFHFLVINHSKTSF